MGRRVVFALALAVVIAAVTLAEQPVSETSAIELKQGDLGSLPAQEANTLPKVVVNVHSLIRTGPS